MITNLIGVALRQRLLVLIAALLWIGVAQAHPLRLRDIDAETAAIDEQLAQLQQALAARRWLQRPDVE